jgi:hypothetical protein
LQSDAQSGHEHLNFTSPASGMSPFPVWAMTSMTASESLPWSSARADPTLPAHCWRTAFHFASDSGAMVMRTSYSSEPLTTALSSPFAMLRCTTLPLRA